MEVVRGHRRGKHWTKVGHGLYATTPGPASTADVLRTWALVLPPGAAFTHLSAAEVRGWWLPAALDHPVFAAVQAIDAHPKRRGLLVSRHPGPVDAEHVEGLRVTRAAETLLAAARDLGVLDLVLMGDSALRLGHCTVEEVEELSRTRRRGAPLLRTVVPMLDPRSESPWESVMRVLHRAADIEVVPQRNLYDESGRFVARADLWVVGTSRIHEYDGAGHRDPATHRADLRRDRALLEIGIQRFGYTAGDLIHQGGKVIAATDRALGREWNPARLRRWNALVDASLLGHSGRKRARKRWFGN